jgi:hypothetical protein
MAVLENGEVYGWGYNGNGQVRHQIYCSILTRESRVRLAVLENGEVSTAGDTTETDR